MDAAGNSTQHDNLLYFELFMKSSVTSDYNEMKVSVTRALRAIFHLSFVCTVATLAFWGFEVSRPASPARETRGSKESLSSFSRRVF